MYADTIELNPDEVEILKLRDGEPIRTLILDNFLILVRPDMDLTYADGSAINDENLLKALLSEIQGELSESYDMTMKFALEDDNT